MVVCAVCRSKHEPATPFPESLQGDGCAASIFQHKEHGWVLYASYGSTKFDGDVYWVDLGLRKELDPVCDTCIQDWIDQGKLKFISNVFS